jgi:hypothetical protein
MTPLSISVDSSLYRTIQSSLSIFKGLVEEIVWNKKCKVSSFSKFRHRFRGMTFLRSCRVYYCDYRFLKFKELILIRITINLFPCLQWKKESKPFVAFFNCHFRVLLFWVLFCSCGGDLSDLLPVLLSESDNCASTMCTSTNSEPSAPVKRSQ